MRHTLKFIFSLLFVCISLFGNAQEKKKDSVVPKTERFGVRFGVDLFKLTRSFYEKDYRGLELVGEFKKQIHANNWNYRSPGSWKEYIGGCIDRFIGEAGQKNSDSLC